jgi:hypothetical protein
LEKKPLSKRTKLYILPHGNICRSLHASHNEVGMEQPMEAEKKNTLSSKRGRKDQMHPHLGLEG